MEHRGGVQARRGATAAAANGRHKREHSNTDCSERGSTRIIVDDAETEHVHWSGQRGRQTRKRHYTQHHSTYTANADAQSVASESAYRLVREEVA